MLTGKTYTLRSHPSLLPLRKVLIAAESESPARPPRMDANEQRALQLIARMQSGYKKVLPFLEDKEIPVPQGFREHVREVAGTYAR